MVIPALDLYSVVHRGLSSKPWSTVFTELEFKEGQPVNFDVLCSKDLLVRPWRPQGSLAVGGVAYCTPVSVCILDLAWAKLRYLKKVRVARAQT